MTALPTSVAFTASTVTEEAFKTAITDMRAFIAGLIGEDGTAAAARAAMGLADSSITTVSSIISQSENLPGGGLNIAVFFQASAPTGWTQRTEDTDALLRVASAAGGGRGGSWIISGLSSDDHELTVSELPVYYYFDNPGSVNDTRAGGAREVWGNSNSSSELGGGEAHSHTITSDGSWRPSYIDVIKAARD